MTWKLALNLTRAMAEYSSLVTSLRPPQYLNTNGKYDKCTLKEAQSVEYVL